MKLQPRNKMSDETDYYRLASGFYLANELPEDYLELDGDTYFGLLEQTAWQPFEGHSGANIAFHIENLSVAMENIARDARKGMIQLYQHPAGHAYADWKVVQRRYKIAGEYRYKDCYFGDLQDGDEYFVPEAVQDDSLSPIAYMRDNGLKMRTVRDENHKKVSLRIYKRVDELEIDLVNYPWVGSISSTLTGAVDFIRDMEEQNAE